MNKGYVNELLKARGNLQLFRGVIHRIAGFLSLKYAEEYHCSDKTVLMTVLRAGSALERSFLKRTFPAPQLHYIRTKRDSETLKAKVLDKTFGENCEKAYTDAVLILEPMLATGGTIEVVVDEINKTFNPEQVFIISVFVSKIAEEMICHDGTYGLMICSDFYLPHSISVKDWVEKREAVENAWAENFLRQFCRNREGCAWSVSLTLSSSKK